MSIKLVSLLLSSLFLLTPCSAMERGEETQPKNRVHLINSYSTSFPLSFKAKEKKIANCFYKDESIDEELVGNQLGDKCLDSSALVYQGWFINPYLINDSSMIFERICLPSVEMKYFTHFPEYFHTVQSLDLSSNQLRKLTLTGMTSLRSVNVSRNKLSSLDVSFLPNLQRLDASGNQIKYMLISNPLLNFLDGSDNPLETLVFNRDLERLDYLNLDQTSLKNFQFLEQSPNLETLSLYEVNLKIIPEEISSLQKLKSLTVSMNQLTSLQGLPGSVEVLSAGWNHITSIRPLSVLAHPTNIDLTSNPITDIGVVREINFNTLIAFTVDAPLEEQIPQQVKDKIKTNRDEYHRQPRKLDLSLRPWG